MSLSFLAPNCHQGKRKHTSSFAEYSNQVWERYQLGLNAQGPWLKMCMGYVCRTICVGVLSFKPCSPSPTVKSHGYRCGKYHWHFVVWYQASPIVRECVATVKGSWNVRVAPWNRPQTGLWNGLICLTDVIVYMRIVDVSMVKKTT